MGLLLLLFGALQSGLSEIGAGQTELAYTIANLRNGASLKPIPKAARFEHTTTKDTDLQQYFYLDPETGSLTLRDGLRSLSTEMNPLSSFPYRIKETVPGQNKRKVTSLYIQFLNCKDFLAKQPASGAKDAALAPRLSDADAALRCMQIGPVIAQPSTLTEITSWIDDNSKQLLGTLRKEYLSWAKDILSLPKPPPDYAWEAGSPSVRPGQTPVWRLFILQDRAEPGLRIYSVAAPPSRNPRPEHWSNGSRPGAAESAEAALLRSLDEMFLLFLQLRYPALITFGILFPLVAWIMRQRDVVVRHCLEPYLLLLLAQVMTLFLAEALMGEGLVIWVGFIYTLLRLVQLVGLFKMSSAENHRLRKLFNLRSRPCLENLLRLQLVLWSVNALGLGWHIVGVGLTFRFISPA